MAKQALPESGGHDQKILIGEPRFFPRTTVRSRDVAGVDPNFSAYWRSADAGGVRLCRHPLAGA
jgi:hypothetical protein